MRVLTSSHRSRIIRACLDPLHIASTQLVWQPPELVRLLGRHRRRRFPWPTNIDGLGEGVPRGPVLEGRHDGASFRSLGLGASWMSDVGRRPREERGVDAIAAGGRSAHPSQGPSPASARTPGRRSPTPTRSSTTPGNAGSAIPGLPRYRSRPSPVDAGRNTCPVRSYRARVLGASWPYRARWSSQTSTNVAIDVSAVSSPAAT